MKNKLISFKFIKGLYKNDCMKPDTKSCNWGGIVITRVQTKQTSNYNFYLVFGIFL